MTYSAAEARQELLDVLGGAADDIGVALACLGEAYELLDENAADRLEETIFGPVQSAYGKARRTHTAFAQRHNLPERSFPPQAPRGRPGQVREAIEAAAEAASDADAALTELQDSMRPVEVGDAELRAGLAEVRTLIGQVPGQTRELLRTLGR